MYMYNVCAYIQYIQCTSTLIHTHTHSYATYPLPIEGRKIGAYSGFPQDGGGAHSEHGETQTSGAEGRGAKIYNNCI